MQVNITGYLIDPTGYILPNHNIRVTDYNELTSIESTDSNGEYSFILTEGIYKVEVLFNKSYLLVGDIIVDDSTPSPLTLEGAIKYSYPITVEDVYELPNDLQSLQDTLEDGSFTRTRESREQLVEAMVHEVDLTKAYISEDSEDRSISNTYELGSCDATITSEDTVYSDQEGNSYSHTTDKQSTKHGSVKSRTLIDDYIQWNQLKELGNCSIDSSEVLNSSGLVRDNTITVDSASNTNQLSISDTEVSNQDSFNGIKGSVITTTLINGLVVSNTAQVGNTYLKSILDTEGVTTETKTNTVNGKVTSVVTTNDGSTTTRTTIVDNYKIGREGNTLFEVDNKLNRVTVRGSLRITDIEDENGNPIDLPEDGDTIFQVFRYGETSNGPWEDTLQSYHVWKQENTSVNGYIDPNGWSIAYRFIGEDVTGDAGDTIYYEYQYSPDGLTDWTTEMKAGDAFRRERRVVNNIPEAWSEAARIKGTDGDEIEIRIQYSVDGINNWHDVFVSGDIYERRARFVNGVQDSPWTDPIKMQGEDGDAGIPGLNGSGWYSIVGNGGVWPGDTQATTDFINNFGRVPQLDDHLFYIDQDPDPTQTDGKRCITPAGDSPIQWEDPTAYFDGSVIVKGTLSADRLVAQSITGNEIDSQTTIIAGSGSTTAGINGYDLATLPDWMGGGSNPYADYRFWAGSSTPEFANFTVDKDGKMKANDGEFRGTIILQGTSGLKVESQSPFGPDDLLEWRGPVDGKLDSNGDVVLSTLTKVNAVTYYSDDNDAYFGGSILAGTLTTSTQNPSTNLNVVANTGTFGSNGGQIVVLCSLSSRGGTGEISGVCSSSSPDPTATMTLYEIVNGNRVFVKSENYTGTFICSPEGGNVKIESYFINGSFTYYDDQLVDEDREYEIDVTFANTFGSIDQRISIVTQE